MVSSTNSALAQVFAKGPYPKHIAYITYKYPDHDTSIAIARILAENGVDILELGIPFTDPMADGPVIQDANTRALENGFSMKDYFKAVESIKAAAPIPVIAFSYYNPVFTYGLASFCEDGVRAGVDGMLLLDVPPEESREYRACARKHSIDTVFLASPTTSRERLRTIAGCCTGFLYYVSRTGVTGTRDALPAHVTDELIQVRKTIHMPLAVGFGIATPGQIQTLTPYADAVVVGSALVKHIDPRKDTRTILASVSHFAAELFRREPS